MAIPDITDDSGIGDEPRPVLTTVAVNTHQAGSFDSLDNLQNTWLRAWYRLYAGVLKRTIDIIVASVALLLLAPLFIFVSAAIRIDSTGPVLYRQQRMGRRGTPFTILKFRTMAHEPRLGLVLLDAPDGSKVHKIRNDPRITRVGSILRRSSIDELPQLLNILLGHMSLIGPRPEIVDIVHRYHPWQHRRHEVRPGLTGWWQVCGRSDRPMHENTELDLYYVDHLTPGLDLKILVRTVMVVIRGRGAF